MQSIGMTCNLLRIYKCYSSVIGILLVSTASTNLNRFSHSKVERSSKFSLGSRMHSRLFIKSSKRTSKSNLQQP